MKKILVIAGLILIVSAAAVAVAQNIVENSNKTYSWRYKMTVEVETPEGIKTGSVVREITAILKPYPLDEQRPYRTEVSTKGEAVAVDMGERGVLFALLDTDDHRLVFNAFPMPGKKPGVGGTTPAGLEYYSTLKEIKATLEPRHYPKLVRFSDPRDPKTVELVLETGDCLEKDENGTCINRQFHIIADRFEEMFGKGVRLKEITVEMTNEPIAWGIKKRLLWIDEYHNKLFDGQKIHTTKAKNRLANSLGAGSFTTQRMEHE